MNPTQRPDPAPRSRARARVEDAPPERTPDRATPPDRASPLDRVRWWALTLRERAMDAVRVPALAGTLLVLAVLGGAVAVSLLRGGVPGANALAEAGAAPEAAVAERRGSPDAPGDPANPGTPGAPAGPTQDDPAAANGAVWVHVLGEVNEPGVYRLNAGERVIDAMRAAGGASEAAALDGVNLARPVADGEQLRVPDAELAREWAAAAGPPAPAAAGSAPDGTGAVAGAEPGLVNLNTASAEELQTLPRVGPALAERILAHVADRGGFGAVEDLLLVSGIGERTLAGLRDLVTV